MADWPELPKDALELIANKLSELRDCHSVAAVCVSWRSVALECLHRHLLSKFFPKLVIAGETKDIGNRPCLEPSLKDGYFTFTLEKKNKDLPMPDGYYCCGSSSGWLGLVDDKLEMQVFNPLSGVKFHLPSGGTIPGVWSKYYITKAVATSTSVLIFIRSPLGCAPRFTLCKIGDKSWTPIKAPEEAVYMDAIDMCIIYQLFYVVSYGLK